MQAAGGNPVGADFILLDLLKRQLEFTRHIGLGLPSQGAGLLESATDVNVYRVGHSSIPQVEYNTFTTRNVLRINCLDMAPLG
jgi:hypothetical protein